MTKLNYVWTNGMDSKIFTTYPEVVEYQRVHGGRFRANYIEGKDVDYEVPTPNTKRFTQRLCARG